MAWVEVYGGQRSLAFALTTEKTEDLIRNMKTCIKRHRIKRAAFKVSKITLLYN